MDDLLREFLAETGEHLDVVDVELVRFEQDPNNATILRNIFRLVHTIKGTCGFLGLPRLEALAHAAETVMGRFRDGMPVTSDAVTLILATIDRIKAILEELERTAAEPEGSDADLVGGLESLAAEAPAAAPPERRRAIETGTLTPQILERPLKPDEVSLDELERAFRETQVELPLAPAPTVPPRTGRDADHQAAEKIEGGPDGAEAAIVKTQTIRVNVDTLEHLMTMVSELVLTRNQLLEIARRQDDAGYKVPLQRLSQVTAELQDGVMKTRMQPIGTAWQKLPRVVRDLAGDLGKTIELVMQGAETELDRQVIEVIKDPLTHMVRNSADHGIETALERKRAGKPERGTVRLSAYHEGGTITIEIADDGRGLDFPAIRRKVRERGLAAEAELERMSDVQVAKFIFQPGFSTAKEVTAISGRGVGMDVVKSNIELIGGTIDIRSERGRGTTFTIKIPLTLAIVPALIVAAHDQRFAMPQVAVLELVRVKPGSAHAIERLNGTPVLRLREQLLPIIPMSRALNLPEAETNTGEDGFVVVTQVGRQRFGVLVDAVFHTEEIVVKPLSSKLRHIKLFSGNTILGDGAVALIVDPNGIARTLGAGAVQNQPLMEESGDQTQAEAADTVTFLIFRGGSQSPKAVPLSLVTRLEEVDSKTIEWIGGRPLIQYRGGLMPLVPADPGIAIRSEGTQALVVFSDGERSMGLLVDEIVDIVDELLDVELVADRSGLVGSAVVRGRATEVVDIAHYLPLAHADWLQPTSARLAGSGRTVLLVDDKAFFRDMLTPVLKAAGFRVVVAEGADEALSLLRTGGRADVLVTDIEMPGKDGFQLVEALRAESRFAHLPAIALSSGLAPGAVERGRRLGIVAFVAKFDRSGLIAALAETQPVLGEAA
jgi:two-component system, chemotaxis family, sensor kinase CheA